MRLNRFIIDFNEKSKEIEITELEVVKQIRKVLKLIAGDSIIVSNGKGLEFEAQIKLVTSASVSVLLAKKLDTKEVRRKVSLYLAILKKENFELAVQKAVECGVSKIVPIITERTIKTGLNQTRLEKIIKEACEQSGRGSIPTLSSTLSFQQALEESKSAKEKIIFHPKGENYKPQKESKEIAIFVGPEGGFTDKEIETAQSHNIIVSSLGDQILRGETAAIVATYRAVHGI